ncbi:hypothetical protein FRC15_008229 [Serendipita sp. 397]|nr:hypothetical protein FRC15_008229 [Serendipita sp. 397]
MTQGKWTKYTPNIWRDTLITRAIYHPSARLDILTAFDTMCCGPTTVYTATTVTTSVATAIPITTSLRPYATIVYGNRSICVGVSGTECVSYSTKTETSHFDYLFGRILTTTITSAIPVTTVRTIPIATTTVPCAKREIVEEREEVGVEVEKRSAAAPIAHISSKAGVALLSLALSTWLLA